MLIFLIHGLYSDKKEILNNFMDNRNLINIDDFRLFIEYYLNHDYLYVSPTEILNGLSNEKKYILITFDDGYFNNQYALPILKEYRIPAVFFISINNVKFNKSFWWDVLFRERRKQGKSVNQIRQEIEQLKQKKSDKIEKYLKNLFNEEAFKPISDIDRPFTISELKDFSKNKYVFLGNHTCDHAILTNYSNDDIKKQILNAQNEICDIIGEPPIIIAYPDGKYSDEVIRISKEVGLELGITINPEKNFISNSSQINKPMRLGRFILYENDNIINQCESFRSDLGVSNWIIKMYRRKK